MLSQTELQEALDQFLDRKELPGQLLFAKVWGSYSHNCAHDGSDLDMLAVYQLPSEEILGLTAPREDVMWAAGNGAPFDLEAHEVGKFCRLILKGGPAALETLFTDRLFWASPDFEALMREGERFLSKRAVRQYIGYAEGQLRRLANGQSLHTKGGKMSEKWSYHFSRLAIDAERVAYGKPPLVWKDGEERDALMRVRSGETSAEVATTKTAAAIASLRERQSEWTVRDEPDEAWMNRWLVNLRVSDIMCPGIGAIS